MSKTAQFIKSQIETVPLAFGGTCDTYARRFTLDRVSVEATVFAKSNKATSSVRVKVNLLPGFMSWSLPESRELRKIVDEVLAEYNLYLQEENLLDADSLGWRRMGRREERNIHPGWEFSYPIVY